MNTKPKHPNDFKSSFQYLFKMKLLLKCLSFGNTVWQKESIHDSLVVLHNIGTTVLL